MVDINCNLFIEILNDKINPSTRSKTKSFEGEDEEELNIEQVSVTLMLNLIRKGEAKRCSTMLESPKTQIVVKYLTLIRKHKHKACD